MYGLQTISIISEYKIVVWRAREILNLYDRVPVIYIPNFLPYWSNDSDSTNWYEKWCRDRTKKKQPSQKRLKSERTSKPTTRIQYCRKEEVQVDIENKERGFSWNFENLDEMYNNETWDVDAMRLFVFVRWTLNKFLKSRMIVTNSIS